MMLTVPHSYNLGLWEQLIVSDWHCKGTEQSFELLLVSVKCGDEMSSEAGQFNCTCTEAKFLTKLVMARAEFQYSVFFSKAKVCRKSFTKLQYCVSKVEKAKSQHYGF